MSDADAEPLADSDPDLHPEVVAMLAARLHDLDVERWPMETEEVRRGLGLDDGPNRLV